MPDQEEILRLRLFPGKPPVRWHAMLDLGWKKEGLEGPLRVPCEPPEIFRTGIPNQIPPQTCSQSGWGMGSADPPRKSPRQARP